MSNQKIHVPVSPMTAVSPSSSLSSVQHRRKRAILGVGLLLLPTGLFTQSWWTPGGGWHEGIEILGLFLIGFCALGRAWCSMYIGGQKNATVIHSGPYSVVRNPLYVFSVIAAGGVGFLVGSGVVGLLFAFLIFLIFNGVSRKEEAFLSVKLGESYRAYLAEVPRWLPRWRLWKNAETLVVRPSLVWITFRDSCLFYLALPLFEGIEKLQLAGYLPVYLWLP